jgi:hypothetical protein
MFPKGDKLCVSHTAVRNPSPKLDDHLLAAFMRAANKIICSSCSVHEFDVLKNSVEHQKARAAYKATMRFIQEKSHYWLPPEGNVEEIIYDKLTAVVATPEEKREIDQITRTLVSFRREIAGLAAQYLALAGNTILATDAVGEYVLNCWGSNAPQAMKYIESVTQDKEYTKITDALRQIAEGK